MRFSSRTALRVPSQPATHAAATSRLVRSGRLSVALTTIGLLVEPHEFGVPFDVQPRSRSGRP